MARDRMIRVKFWEDEKLSQVPLQSRLLFIGTWNIADDSGVLKGNVKYIKSQLFPYDDNIRANDIKNWIDALIDARMLIPFSYNNESYLYIRSFNVHQKVDKPSKTRNVPEEALLLILNSTLSEQSGSSTLPVGDEVEVKRSKVEVEVNTTRDSSIDSDLNNFIDSFNHLKKSKFQITSKVKSAFNARIKEGFKVEQMLLAATNCLNDPYHKENPHYLTPEFILRSDKLDKYLNYSLKVSPINVNQHATREDYTRLN